jgi:hypothetical protein
MDVASSRVELLSSQVHISTIVTFALEIKICTAQRRLPKKFHQGFRLSTLLRGFDCALSSPVARGGSGLFCFFKFAPPA